MRIFYAFLIIIVAVILFMLPLTEAIYDFRTDLREDEFTYATGAGESAANVTLGKPVYDDDIFTIDILSDLSTDNATYSGYNVTSRLLDISGLSDNATRLFTISYDIDALEGSDAINAFMDIIPFIWMLIIIAFGPAALFAIFTGRV